MTPQQIPLPAPAPMTQRMEEIMARLRQYPIPKTEVLLLMAEFATLDGKIKAQPQPE